MTVWWTRLWMLRKEDEAGASVVQECSDGAQADEAERDKGAPCSSQSSSRLQGSWWEKEGGQEEAGASATSWEADAAKREK